MTTSECREDEPDRIGEVMCAVQLPLENLEFTVEQYLLENANRLDPETRMLLAGVRDCLGRVAVSTRRLRSAGNSARFGHAA